MGKSGSKSGSSKNSSKPSNFHRTGSPSKNGRPSTYTW